jgi:hypothetical protein
MLFTPLHPLGHPVQAGGLGVLATEFEGPKKALSKSKALVMRISGTSKPAVEASNDDQPNQNGQPPLGPNPLQNTSELQRSFASSSYVSPFRKQSLPPNNNDAQPPSKQKASKQKASKQKASKQKASKQKDAKPPIPKSKLKRQGSTSLSGGI